MLVRHGATRGQRFTATFGWDLATDTFEVGQCLKDRIDPFASDLSSDGTWTLLSCDARHWNDHYLVLSRAPWVAALAYWPHSAQFSFPAIPPPALAAWDFTSVPQPDRDALGLLNVYKAHAWRLVRDGWVERGSRELEPHLLWVRGGPPSSRRSAPTDSAYHPAAGFLRPMKAQVFERALPDGSTLRRLHVTSVSHPHLPKELDLHELVAPNGDTTLLPTWEWADYDAPRARLVWTADGKVWAASWPPPSECVESGDPVAHAQELYDVVDVRFTRRRAPYTPVPFRPKA